MAAGTITLSSKLNPFPYSAIVISAYTEKTEIVYDEEATGVTLDLNGSKIDNEEDIVHALAKAGGLSEDSASAASFFALAKTLKTVTAVPEIMTALDTLDDHLAWRTFVVGHQITSADWILWGALKSSTKIVGLLKNGKHAHLTRWYSHLESLGSTQAALASLTAAKASKARGTKVAAGFALGLDGAETGKVVTRFPPEPSGYLHIGHAKAAMLNQYFAKMYNGKLIVRFDDTNPSKEKSEFEQTILEDLELLDIRGDVISHTSDHFDQLYDLAVKLIESGKAYADDTEREQMQRERGEGIASAHRNDSVEDSLKRFAEMKSGSAEGSRWFIRAKMSVDDANKALRDPVIYRCNATPHHRTGDKWKIYPTYDFCCPVVDSLEGVTHALRTTEYHDRNPQYQWFIDALALRKVRIWDFSRLNFIYTLLSKRKLHEFVNNGQVRGWDDPRFPTVRGIRRRGLSVEALRQFVLMQGPSQSIVWLEWDTIWALNKKVVDPIAPRHWAVLEDNKVQVTIKGGSADAEVKSLPKHKKNPDVGEKKTVYSSSILIEQEDAKSFEDQEEITLMDWGNAIVRAKSVDASGTVTSVEIDLHLEGDFKKTKKKITWLSQPTSSHPLIPVTLLDYDYLITKKKLEENDDVKDYITPVTEFRQLALADANVKDLKRGDYLQFERKGYFLFDGESKEDGRMEFIKIPDGKAANLASKAAGAVSSTAQKGSGAGPKGEESIIPDTEKVSKMYKVDTVYGDNPKPEGKISNMHKVDSIYKIQQINNDGRHLSSMATISIDLSAILREIRLAVTEIRNERTAEKEKTKAAQLLVYRAFSLHPALDHMQPPTGILADVDWYTELRSVSSTIFRRLGQNEHFQRMALLGDIGTRARIMVLLLWIIGHRLSEDALAKLLSTAFADALRRDLSTSLDLQSELLQLDSVTKVLVSLRKMIKTKLPLPADRNPFQGPDYDVKDEDKPLPRSSLWGYELPQEQQYEYDVRRNPVLLLRPLPDKVIIPQTKLTILVIQWAACNFGLGKKVYSASEIDPQAFWNADPPPPPDQDHYVDFEDDDGDMGSLLDWSSTSSSSQKNYAFEGYFGVTAAPYEIMLDDEPTEEFIHSRFCSVYKMHDWAHQSIIRVLLFNAFCASQRLPVLPKTLSAAFRVADWLTRWLSDDVCHYMEKFIIARSLLVWREKYASQGWDLKFSALSSDERGMLVIFVDVVKWDDVQYSKDTILSQILSDIRGFYTHPTRSCQDGVDIISLPLLTSQHNPGVLNVLPELDINACTCGECSLISSRLPTSLQYFRHQYFSVVSSRLDRNHCDALAQTWEPAILAAEEWLDGLVSRVESQFMLFPWTEVLDRRIGPAVLELANALGVRVGMDLSDDQLLRLIVMLSMVEDDYPPAVPRSSGPSGLGYVVSLPWAADREDHCIEEEQGNSSSMKKNSNDRVLFVRGGWLYDTIGLDGVSVMHERDECTFVFHTFMVPRFLAVCIPSFRSDSISLFPSIHTLTTITTEGSQVARLVSPQAGGGGGGGGGEERQKGEDTMVLTLVLSNWKTDVFPLLSVLSTTSNPDTIAPRGALAALIKVDYFGRTVESFWKPDVGQGIPCEHADMRGRATRCSLKASDLFRRILPTASSFGEGRDEDGISTSARAGLNELEFGASGDAASSRQQNMVRKMMDEHARKLEPLTKVGAPLERTRVCIVRCGMKDGPVDAVVVLAASVKKKVYVLNYKECWECAIARMAVQGRSIGVAIDVKHVTVCDQCEHT
ncbi:hypothetical protein D9757_006541 [Collybiopsis confluens]|uniref:glutamate--tRNA ligase n=1 Tax=Collybiopsis confluens TaxID=2823264 RepID=A0A8H5HQF0_9AGAR|nr:hypothetical protein D9757_006541 [Collybiopsis confluens]